MLSWNHEYSHSIWWFMPIEIVLEIFLSDNLFSLEVIRDKNQYQDKRVSHLHQVILFTFSATTVDLPPVLSYCFRKIFPFLKLSSSRWITSVFTNNKQPLRFFCNLKDGLKKIMACTNAHAITHTRALCQITILWWIMAAEGKIKIEKYLKLNKQSNTLQVLYKAVKSTTWIT